MTLVRIRCYRCNEEFEYQLERDGKVLLLEAKIDDKKAEQEDVFFVPCRACRTMNKVVVTRRSRGE